MLGDKLKTVHPRVCGEQNMMPETFDAYNGSSPRVRGTGSWIDNTIRSYRFIPACAGNSPGSERSPSPRSVHPRVCGEQDGLFNLFHCVSGSSPRVRGTAAEARAHLHALRFIPACAGNRCRLIAVGLHGPVHPRVCGEQWPSEGPSEAYIGSSPRVRGTADGPSLGQAQSRFIPACAGNRAK